MVKTVAVKRSGMAMLLVGCVLVGAAAAQDGTRVSYINSGLFTVLPGELAVFHVSLDDNRNAPSSAVVLQFYDEDGDVAESVRRIVLEPGKSARLVLPRTARRGHYRAHATVVDADGIPSARRRVVGVVEVHPASGDLTNGIRVICAPDAPAGQGRVP